MENWMDLGVRWKVEAVGDWTNALQYFIWPIKTWRELHGRSHLNRELAIRLYAEENPITNFKFAFTSMFISLMLHAGLCSGKIFFEKTQDLSAIAKNTIYLIYHR
jgi:hypothetical protein